MCLYICAHPSKLRVVHVSVDACRAHVLIVRTWAGLPFVYDLQPIMHSSNDFAKNRSLL